MRATHQDAEARETQLDAVRDLMLQAGGHGQWLTLQEIAEHTQYGEASISAQLRHLRKPCHGRYGVEKRLRRVYRGSEAGARTARMGGGQYATEAGQPALLWEYRVFPPR